MIKYCFTWIILSTYSKIHLDREKKESGGQVSLFHSTNKNYGETHLSMRGGVVRVEGSSNDRNEIQQQ